MIKELYSKQKKHLKVVLFTCCFFLFLSTTMASHFRYGDISYRVDSNDATGRTIIFKINSGWGSFVSNPRLTYVNSSGSSVFMGTLPSNSTGSSNGAQYVTGELTYTFPANGLYTVFWDSGNKIGGMQNNSNQRWRIYTIVNVGSGNNSPVTSLPAIVNLQEGLTNASFNIPAADPDGDSMTYRLATNADGFYGSQPSGFSVSTNGLATFNTQGKTVGHLYNAAIIITDSNGAEIIVDFIIQITQQSNPPQWDYSAGKTPANGFSYQASPGQTITFPVEAFDNDPGSTVSITASGMPVGANISPSFGTTGNPINHVFSWTPTATQFGQFLINFIAQDNNGVQITTSVSINVSLKPVFDVPPTPVAGVHNTIVSPGDLIQYTVQASDPDPADVVQIISIQGRNSMMGTIIPIYSGASFSPLPTVASNPTSGVFSWTPTQSQWGHKHVIFTAEDSYGEQVTHEVSQLVNTPPIFSSTPILTADVGVPYSYTIEVTDPDLPYGDTLTIIGNSLPTWLTVTDNGNGTATLSGTPTVANVGVNTVNLQAEDLHHHMDLRGTIYQNFNITVNNIDPCDAVASGNLDSDSDGVSDICDEDDDNDGILDVNECESLLIQGGFENISGLNFGNNIGVNIAPWILGAGNQANVIKVDGSGGFNYGSGGPFEDANTNTGSGTDQYYLDIAGGSNDFYQVFTITQPTTVSYSGYFSSRDNVDGEGSISIYSGNLGSTGTLIDGSGTLNISSNGDSQNNPWEFVQRTVSLNAGTYSFVVGMNDFSNFDEGRLVATICDTDLDGIPNSQDLDSDGDGCLDVVESGGIDANNDGILDGSGLDTNNGRITGGTSGYNGATGNETMAHQLAIITSPSNQTANDLSSATFNVIASAEQATIYNAGSPIYGTTGNSNSDIKYQWFLGDPSSGGTALTESGVYSGTDSSTLSISNVNGLNGNEYYVVLTHDKNACLEAINSAQLTVLPLGSIGDTIWYDTNGDGSQNGSEGGLEGVTVTLDPGTPGNTADDIITLTDANGNYSFPNLPAGNYNVSADISTVTGGLPGVLTIGDLSETFDDDGIGTPSTSAVTLAIGEDNSDQDFGYSAGIIGDTVWYDTDGDGIKDTGEPGLEGATVTLDPGTPSDPSDDIIITSDVNGNYLFTGLPIGDYIVSVDINSVTSGIPSGKTPSDLIQTYDADGLGSPSKSFIQLGQGEINLDQDFAWVAPTGGGTTGGNNGGVESESLGDAISKIYVGRKKNSVPTVFVKDKSNLYNKTVLQAKQPYQGKGQTMLDMFPTELVAGNVANVTSPTDILDYTIADEVLSVDFSIDGETKGVVLGIKTSDKVYNHTKASCDRLRGAEILNIQKIKVGGYDFLMQGIKQRNGIVEYAISFAAAKNNNDTNYTMQSNWYVNDYIKYNDMYNFQVWSTNPRDTQKLVADILTNLKSFIPVAQTEQQRFPETYASKIFRDKGELVVQLRSTKDGHTANVDMVELYSETANNIKHRNSAIATEIQQDLRFDIADGYEYDGLIQVDNEVEDAFYHADGNWGLDYDKRYTEIKNYFVWNDFDREYKDDEYTINRSVEIKAESDYDYLTIYKSLLPGTISADYSEYKYLAFTAKGSGLMELGLVKSSIQDWKQQYRIMVDLSEEEQTYYIPFDAFSSVGTQETIVADDLTTLTFTFLPVEANTTTLDLFISDVKFTKVAGDGLVVNKVETFENEFIAYPNPSQGNVNLMLFSQSDTQADVSLTDLTGKVIYRGTSDLTEGKNELQFGFMRLKPGMYLLKVASKEADYGTSKLIIR